MLGNSFSGRDSTAHGFLPSDDNASREDLSLMVAGLMLGVVVGVGSAMRRLEPKRAHAAAPSQPINWLRSYSC